MKTYLHYGIDLEGTYHSFFETGLRASQQLDGEFRERTMQEYDVLRQQIQGIILERLEEISIRKRNADLKRLLSEEMLEGISESDRERVVDIVKKLKESPVENPRIISKFYYDFERRVGYYKKQFDQRNPLLAETFLRFPPGARTDFLELAKWFELNGEGRYANTFRSRDEHEELLEVVEKLDRKNGTRYINVLALEMRRDEGFRVYYNQLREGIDELDEKQRDLFFEMLLRAQEENVPYDREELPLMIAELVGPYSEDQARQFGEEAFKLIRNKGFEAGQDYLNGMLKKAQ